MAQIFNFKIPKINLIYSSDADKIYVFDVIDGNNSKRYLTFSPEFHLASKQGTIYTKQKDKIASIYVKMMLCGFALKSKPEKILIVGMGIGVMPREIAEFFPSVKMDVVEISSKVIDVAIEYFDFQKTGNMNIFIQDGYDFILNSSQKYDMIFFDVFNEDYIPKEFLTDDFILNLKNILQKDGLLIFNTFTNSKTYKLEEEIIQSKFTYNKQILLNNRIIFSSDNLLEESKISKNFANKIEYKKYCNKLENI